MKTKLVQIWICRKLIMYIHVLYGGYVYISVFFLCPQMIYYSYKQFYECLILHHSVFHHSHKQCGEKKKHVFTLQYVIKSLT